jgi:hypothetical protein
MALLMGAQTNLFQSHNSGLREIAVRVMFWAADGLKFPAMSHRPPRTAPDPSEDEDDAAPQSMDQKDQIIAQQQKMIKELQTEFAGTLDALRSQLRDYVDESSRVQNDMLDRICELKGELKGLQKRQSASTQKTTRSSLSSNSPKRPRVT